MKIIAFLDNFSSQKGQKMETLWDPKEGNKKISENISMYEERISQEKKKRKEKN